MSLTHLGLHIVGNFHGRSHLTQTHPWSPALGVGTPGVRSHVSLGTGRQQRGPGDGCAGRWAGDVVLCGAQASPTFACRNVFWENCRLAGAFLFSHSFTRQSSHTNTSPVKVPAAAWACPQRRAAARTAGSRADSLPAEGACTPDSHPAPLLPPQQHASAFPVCASPVLGVS